MSYKKSIISVIIALLLIGSVVTLTLSPFQKASAQNTSNAAEKKAQEAFNTFNRLPGSTNQGQQETTTSNPIKKAPETRPLDLTGNTNQGQGQSNPGQGEEHRQQGKAKGKNKHNVEEDFVPIATSGNDNVYLAWPSNKTTPDFEIMFKTSTDGGKTFGPKINLSNSTGIDSERPQIAAAGNNVYVTWWERVNATSNEPVMRVSNDNGKTFGPPFMLTTGATSTVVTMTRK
jgi:type II secretory pathway pseudopilin PulG